MSIEDKIENNIFSEPKESFEKNSEKPYFKTFSEYILMYDPSRILVKGYKNKGSVISKVLSERLGELNFSVKRILENIPVIIYTIPKSEEIFFYKKLEELKEEGFISSYERSGMFYALKEE